MKKFIVERIFPGAGNLSPEELQAISQAYCKVVIQLGRPYHWIQSFVTEDKIFCIHVAENEEMVREHARLGKFPINTISEVKFVIDPSKYT
ncbi:DUF4242 domain-containing protein [Flavitalea flava]